MGQAITHARKGSTIIFVTVFGKMVNKISAKLDSTKVELVKNGIRRKWKSE